ncbi:MAG: hypothetical protein DRO04_00725 [Candidatus Iainarchaeum archaeon]|uniref:Glycosyltransferase n=1 Tax=Candidatus Iainarchaeum sp. TaxID=3101447 RepID=A0A497JJC9_9ARCH|nr:MAG: hypothetical protein DRO04_00725 [Candidatus Diapherotrites archaeon]
MNETKGVYIAVLNQGWIRPELSFVLTDITHQGKYNVYLSYPADKPIQNNRNKIVKKFLEKKEYDFLLMIDSDIVPPLNILDLADYNLDIVGALCFAFRDHRIVPLVLKENKRGRYQVMEVDGSEGLVECDAVGSGCIMIHRRVLEHPKMRYPFKNYYDEDGIRVLGLDLSFCKRAKELGFKVYCHLDFPCSHWTPMDLKEVYQALCEREIKPIKLLPEKENGFQ